MFDDALTWSGIRSRAAGESLPIARALSKAYGVRRVFDVTHFDRVGLPVFAAVRPAGQAVCVHSGKGETAVEAELGALLEAIEVECAEMRIPESDISYATPRQYHRATGIRVSDYCPIVGRAVDVDKPIRLYEAEDIELGSSVLVPAEVIEYPSNYGDRPQFLGWTTTGLAAGSSVSDASVHGLYEVMERDICSFEALLNMSSLVRPESLPPGLRDVSSAIASAGLEGWLRYVPNVFQIPSFRYVLVDREARRLSYINAGYGTHQCALTAAKRAMYEAIQSRIAMIHGGREDLERFVELERALGPDGHDAYVAALLEQTTKSDIVLGFDDVPSGASSRTVADELGTLIDCLKSAGLGPVLRITYPEAPAAIPVVRIVVPRAENFSRATAKVGCRLRDALRARRVGCGKASV